MSILNNKSPIRNDRMGALNESVLKNTSIKPAGPAPENKPQKTVVNDSSIFHGKKELTRYELKQAFKKNFQGSGMSDSERIGIEKKDFPSFYGGNISKDELKMGVSRLNQKLSDSRISPQEKIKIRKEIKYIKGIGGI